jgi:GDP-mannose 6-dehydrogenase
MDSRTTEINVVGIGHVGLVSAAAFANKGFHVHGIETCPVRVAQLKDKQCPIPEPGLAELLATTNSLRFFHSDEALPPAPLWLICVGTPQKDGHIDLAQIEAALQTVANNLKTNAGEPPAILLRSTVPPGTLQKICIPKLEQLSGLQHGVGFEMYSFPEFLREGTSIADFFAPSLCLLGATAQRQKLSMVLELLSPIFQPKVVSCEMAELVKCACNSFHALKVTFANELGALARAYGVDGTQMMDVLTSDHKLNISSTYLRPGFVFGGPCLQKDTSTLVQAGEQLGLQLPLLKNISVANAAHLARVENDLLGLPSNLTLGVTGLTFKPLSEDLRGSPVVDLLQRLAQQGKFQRIVLFDQPSVLSQWRSVNELFELTSDEDTLLSRSDIVLLGPRALSSRLQDQLVQKSVPVFDLLFHKLSDELIAGLAHYQRIC